MTDYFQLLGLARRPWLEPDAVKERFLATSAPAHPDRIHSASAADKDAAARIFAELNAAQLCLAEPKARLRHLLELERGVKPSDLHAIPAAVADLFTAVGAWCRETDALLAERERTTSPLLRVGLFERAQARLEGMTELQGKLDGFQGRLTAALQALDGRWGETGPAAGREVLLGELEELYRLFGYSNRWQQQLGERRTALMI